MTDVGLVCVVEHCDLTELKEVLLLLLLLFIKCFLLQWSRSRSKCMAVYVGLTVRLEVLAADADDVRHVQWSMDAVTSTTDGRRH